MPTTVGRWGLRVPVGGDPPQVPLWLTNLATDLSNVAMDDQGTLAARPVSTGLDPSNKPGRYWYVTGDGDATQNGRLWRDTGSSWVEIAMAAAVTAAAAAATATTTTNLRRGLASAYRSTDAVAVVGAIITLDQEEFDVSGWFSTITGLYTPTVPGYYRLSWMVHAVGSSSSYFESALYKDGALFKRGGFAYNSGTGLASGGSVVVLANGSNAFGIGVNQHGSNPTITGGASYTYFHAEMVAAS